MKENDKPKSKLAPSRLPITHSYHQIFIIFMAASFIGAFIAGGFALGKHQAKQNLIKVTKIMSSPSPIADETASWKTYTGNVFSLKYPATWFLSPGTQSVTLSDAEMTKDSYQVVQVSFFEEEVPIGVTSSTRVYIKNPYGGYAVLEKQNGGQETFNQIISTFKFTEKIPASTCVPRPSCLDNPLSMCDPKEPAEGWCAK